MPAIFKMAGSGYTATSGLPFFTLACLLFLQFPAGAQEDAKMVAHFINVGQADATLLEFPCGAVLIDAGAQGPQQEESLVDYLEGFFDRRTDLNRTLDLVIVTHAHLDHNSALDNVARAFTIRRYIDNGLVVGSGKKNQNWLRNNSRALDIQYATYSYEQILKQGGGEGITNDIIDPLNCEGADPQIYLLSGRFTKKTTDWRKTDYDNGNNHSLVIKVVFGGSSFLFTGDLETKGLEKLLETYSPELLDVDVLRVGHHGADNATTPEYLEVVSPRYAVISCGTWSFGKAGGNFTTYAYGHPRVSILDQLQNHIQGRRSFAVQVKAATASRQFINYTVTRRVYATPWDGTIRIEADLDGRYRVMREMNP